MKCRLLLSLIGVRLALVLVLVLYLWECRLMLMLRKVDGAMAREMLINSSPVDMYNKCSSLRMAQQVFETMPKHRLEFMEFNSVTFVGVLGGCHHRGIVAEGRKYFDMMVKEYKIELWLEHYGCLVDFLCRSGFIDEALEMLTDMKIKPDAVIWRSLLDACYKQNVGVELCDEVALQILQSETTALSGVYVLLLRVYASVCQWNNDWLIRKAMVNRGMTKEPDCSLIEIIGISHELFCQRHVSFPYQKDYKVVDLIEEKLEIDGYSPSHSQANHGRRTR